MILPLPMRFSPPSLPFADLDHPMAFPQPSINPRALAKFWVEQGKMLPFIRYHSPKTTLKHHQFGNSHLPCSPQARWPASWLQKHPDINIQGDVEENPGEELAYLFLIPADLMQPQQPPFTVTFLARLSTETAAPCPERDPLASTPPFPKRFFTSEPRADVISCSRVQH